ncbi:Hypothetical protein CINCED_3A014120 [Cinara cedri]|nr:Hypothetical protein CINCED_3A014120 [Cinara cedri]
METSQDVYSEILYSTVKFRVTGTQLIFYAVIFLVLVLLIKIKLNTIRYEKFAAKISGPPAYPIIGSLLEFIRTPKELTKHLTEICETYGPEPFKIWFGCSLAVILTKPEDIQAILTSPNALEKAYMYKCLKVGVGEGLVTAPVEKWKKQRRMLTPAFCSDNMKKLFFPTVKEKTDILIKNLNKEVGNTQPFNMLEYISDAVFSTLTQTTIGFNLDVVSKQGTDLKQSVLKAMQLVAVRAYSPWLYPEIIYSIYCKFTGYESVFKQLHTLPVYMIRKAKEQRKMGDKPVIVNDDNDSVENKKKRLKVFLDILLELREAGENLTDEDIKYQLATILSTGYESTTITVSFCLLLLAMHQDIQDKVYDEIYSVFGDSDEECTIDNINKLVYLKQVFRETLRLFPPAPVILRELQSDVQIFSGNYMIPKGTTCIIAPMNTHHRPELYPNHRSFNPDNFSPENIAKRHKYSFIPFSGGPRGCIGEKYATMNMTVILATVVRNFSLHTDMKLSDVKLKIDLAARSAQGYPVTIRPRNRRKTT